MQVFDRRDREKIEPLLRWAGGKRFLVTRFQNFLPSDFYNCVYHEPFLGSASLFFALQPTRAILSDANAHLINCYKFVRECPELIADYLRDHLKKTSQRYYYQVRKVYNRSGFSAAQAARFIYLNRTCFNGIFRVNRKGEFNVPYGWKESPIVPDRNWLRKASESLKGTILKVADFERALEGPSRGDFVYLDPPYPPLNRTSNFHRYTKDGFSLADHKRLAEICYDLDNRGCLIMMSNADIPVIRRLFAGFKVSSLPVTRYITCKSIKHQVRELIITNFEVNP
jgi:DNA adenine methylase